jgi:signal transduction histidine kinase
LSISTVDLSAQARDVLAALHECSAENRIVEAVVQEGLAVEVDRVLARQLLENLLGNAWKFTAKRPKALITLEGTVQSDGWLQIAIRDNGEGFDMASSPDVFKPFRRAHGVAEFAGTGIGLATAERIVRLHGGRIGIESVAGQGTTVYFTLPGAPAHRG